MATNEELVVRFRAEADQLHREMNQIQREMNELTSTTRRASRSHARSIENMGEANSEYSQSLRRMKAEQREAMKPHIEELKRTELAYLDAAMGMGTYQGSVEELIATINEIGAAQKAANDAMMANDVAMQASILQTIGMMNNMSTTSSKLQANLRTMGNPLYNLSHGALMATNAIERLVNRSSAAQLALEFLGPNANAKQLADQIALINQGIIRMQMVAIAASIACVALYGSLHKANMEMNPKYAKAYNDMIEKLSEAFKPMKEAFAAVMIPIYKFITALAELIIKFNEAHPTMAKFIQGALMLVPALTLILSPLAVGIGLFLGYRAAIAAVWMLIKPLVLGLAMVSPVAWAVAAAIAGLVVGFSYAYKKIEPFRNAVDKTVSSIKIFAQALVDLSKYLFWTATDGDYLNDWITHLPEGFQNAALVIGKAVAKMHDAIVNFINAVKAAFHGDFSQITQIFANLIPNIIAIIIGGIPGLLLTISNLFIRMSDGAAIGGATLLSKFQEIFGTLINTVITFITTQLPLFVQKGIEILTNLINGIVQALPQIIQAASSIILTLVNGISVLLPTLLNIGIQLIQTIITGIVQLLPAIIESGSKILFSLINGIIPLIPNLINVAMQIIQTLLDTLVKLLPTLLEMGMKILTMLIKGIVDMMPQIIKVAVEVISKLVDTFVKLLPKIIEMGIQLIIALIDGIVKMLPQIIKTVVMLIGKFVEVIIKYLPVIIKAGIQILLALIEGIIKVLPQIGGAIIEIIKTITMILIENLPTLIKLGAQLILALIDGFFTVMGSLWNAIAGKIVPSIWKAFQGIDWSGVGKNIIIGLINGLGALAYKAVMAAYDIGKSIFKTITGFFDIHSPSRLMRGVGEYIIAGMTKGIGNMENPAVRTAKNVATSVRDAFDVLSEDIALGNVAFAGSIPDVSTSYTTPASVSSTASSNFGQQSMVNSSTASNSDNIDNSSVAAAITGLRKDLTNLQVVMEGETVGRIVTPHVNAENAVDNTVRRYF